MQSVVLSLLRGVGYYVPLLFSLQCYTSRWLLLDRPLVDRDGITTVTELLRKHSKKNMYFSRKYGSTSGSATA